MSSMRVFLGVVALMGVVGLFAGCKPGEPLAGFTAEPTSGVAPLKVQFTDASVITKESTITGWVWDFGDGGASTDQDPDHTYTAAGSHTVTLTVTSSDGKTNMATVPNCVTVTLTAVPNVVGLPRADAEAAITGAGLVVGTVTEEHHATVPAGSVISQDPAAGTGVLLGSAVSLVVSSGPGGTGGDTVTIVLPGDVPLELVRIPAGSFQMGSPDTERSRDSDEGPVHTVTIGYDFYMGKYEVTQGQWLAVMGTSPGGYTWDYGVGANYPAYYVSWDDAQAFITAVNAHITTTGQGPATLRLPSEAEWEYACRGGTQTRFYFGDSLGVGDSCEDDGERSQYMWYCGNNADYGSKPVGGKMPNGFGLHDMSGNLYEWCEDWWHSDYTGAPADGSAWVSPTASYRVLRGGNWGYNARSCRSANRHCYYPSYRYSSMGFRLASVR